jgi:hypothetical protein
MLCDCIISSSVALKMHVSAVYRSRPKYRCNNQHSCYRWDTAATVNKLYPKIVDVMNLGLRVDAAVQCNPCTFPTNRPWIGEVETSRSSREVGPTEDLRSPLYAWYQGSAMSSIAPSISPFATRRDCFMCGSCYLSTENWRVYHRPFPELTPLYKPI